ncbi:MAG: Ig-like domain-containing protein [Chitinophagales bacterium]
MVRKSLPCSRIVFLFVALLTINVFSGNMLLAQSAAPVKSVAPSREAVKEVLKESQNSIQFIENKGQWPAQTISVGHTNVGELVVHKDYLNFITIKPHKAEEGEEQTAEEEEDEDNEMHEAHGWGISFDGYNPSYTVENSQPFNTVYNYFLGNGSTNASNVTAYGEQVMKNLYNGIDLRLYSQEKNTLEFDWIVNPGADYHNIKMRFKGQDGLRVDEKGNLSVKLNFQDVTFDIPEVYQVINGKKVKLAANFVVNGDVATFNVTGDVNPNYALIIDPSLKWGIWFDCNSDTFDEYLYAIELDNSGNVYCGGKINMTIPTTYIASGLFGYQNTYQGSVDGIIYKLNANGTAVLAVTYFGSSSQDGVYGLGLSPDKSVLYACGYTQGTIPTTGGTTAFDNAIGGSQDGFVIALPSAALNTLTYSSYIGSSGNGEEMRTIRGLSNNSFIVGGIVTAALTTSGPNYITAAYDASYDGGNEMYIAKFTNFNTLAFGTYVGGNGDDNLNDLNVFSDGAFVFSGSTASTGSFPGLVNSAATLPAGSGTDGVIGVIPSAGGTFTMLSRIGGTNADEFYGCTIGPFDTLYVTGITQSSTAQGFPLGTGTRYDNSYNGGEDGFVGKLPRSGGTNTWQATYFGGANNERGNTLRTYTPYAVMVFGEAGSGFPTQNLSDGGTFFNSAFSGGTWDIFYFVLGTDLQTLYFSTYIGGSQNDYLGATGVPKGSNHFQVEGDSLICLGTTIHSSTLTPNPISASGVFDNSRSNDTDNDDIHLVFKWRIGILLNFDYGDAPISYNGGLNTRPNHIIFNSLRLGTAAIDKEDFHSTSYLANGDDAAGSTPDDEDAITGTVFIQDTATSYGRTFPITNTTGFTATVMGWIDFNGNGTFDANEVDTARVASGATSASLVWTGINFNDPNDTTYMRLRITTDAAFNVASPSAINNASNGEIEDYLVIKYHCVDLTGANITVQSPTTCTPPNGSITIANGNLLPNVTYTIYYSYNGGPQQGPFNLTTANNGTLIIPGLNSGTYTTVQVFHPTNPLCGDTITGPLVLVPTSVATPTASATPNPVCTGQTVQFNATGTGTFSWTGPASFASTLQNPTRVITGTNMAGTYSVTQTVNGCVSNPGTVVLAVNVTPAITFSSSTNPSTCGGSQGSITIAGLNNNTTYTVNFTKNGTAQTPQTIASNGTGQLTISGLTAGTYTNISVTLSGCTSNVLAGPFTLNDPANPAAPTNVTASPNPVCTGATLTLSATGTNLSWTFPSGGGTATGSPVTRTNVTTAMAGTYSVTQTVNNCTSSPATVTVTVNTTPSIAFSSSTNPSTCGGSQGSITVSGLLNNTAYTVNYVKNGSAVGPVTLTSNGSGLLTITGLTAGTYTNITVTLSGCTSAPVAGPITLSDPSTPSAPSNVTANPNPICTGNTLTLSATGSGLQWSYPDGGGASGSPVTRTNVTTAMAGTYSVTQTVAGCTSAPATVSVTVNTTPAIGFSTSANPTTCGGTQGSITISGVLNNTVYSVSYVKNGTAIGPVNITSNASGNLLVISGLTAGSYTNISVTLNGCPSNTLAGPFTLTDPGNPAAPTAVTATPNPVCTGNSLSLSAVGSNLQWTFPDGGGASGTPVVRNPVTAAMGGTYSVTQTVNNCTSAPATVSVTVNVTPAIAFFSSSNPTTCGGTQGSITISGLNNTTSYTVNFSKNGTAQTPQTLTSNGSGQLTINGLTAGTYTNISVTLSGCTSNVLAGPFTLSDPANPAAPTSVTANPNPVCTGGTLTLSAVGSNLSWTFPSGGGTASGSPVVRTPVTAAMGGTYSVTQTVNNCTSAPATVVVTVNTTPNITSVSSSNPTTCSGAQGTITLNGLLNSTIYTVNYTKNGAPQGPFSITSNGTGQVIITGLTAGNYTNISVTLSGCTSNVIAGPISLTDPSTPAAPTNVTASPNPVCTNSTLTLSATGSNLQWTFPDGGGATGSPVTRSLVSIAMGGTYSVTQTVSGCTSAPATVTVTVNTTPQISDAVGTNPTTCGGSQGFIVISGLNPNSTFTVNYFKNGVAQTPVNLPSSGLGNLTISGLTAGTYNNFTVTLNGCTSPAFTGLVVLNNPPNPSAPTLSSNSPRCYGDTLKIFASTISGATYSWSGPGGYTATTQNVTRPSAVPAMSGTYSVTVTQNNCNSSPATISVTVTSCPPVAVNDSYNTNEDNPLTVSAPGVLSNDFDPANPQQPLTSSSLSGCGPYSGSVTLNANGSFTYTPNANFTGVDSFCYRACDNEVPTACDTAVVVITVNPVNDKPVVPDTTVTTIEDNPITVCLPITDPDAGQNHLFNGTLCGPNSGSISAVTVSNASNPHTACFTYTPNANFNGNDSVCVIICDNGTPQLCDTAKVRITVTPVNDPPIANNDNYTANEDATLTVNAATGVRANDNDAADGNPVTSLTVSIIPVCPVQHGTLSLGTDGAFIYTPAANYCGTDSFCYRICDNGTPLPSLCDTGVAHITVNCVNDPPVVPDTTVTTPEDNPLTVCLPISDADAGQNHVFTGTLCGPNSGSISAVTVSNASNPHTACFTYTPNANFNGSDSVCVIICDNGTPQLCDTSKVRITVTPVNDPPIANNDNYTTNEDVAITATAATGVRANDNDALDGNPVTSLTVSIIPVCPVQHGTLSLGADGSFIYTPAANYCGTDSFCYRVCDAGTPTPSLCDTAVAHITVNCVNDPPVVPDTTVTTLEDNPTSVCIPISDPETASQAHSINTIYCGPNNGSISGTFVNNAVNPHQVCVTYTPNANFNGVDSVCLVICDNGSPVLCDTTKIRINVTPVNDPPLAVNDIYVSCVDTPIVKNFLTNDIDIDGPAKVYNGTVFGPFSGTLTSVQVNGNFTYTPPVSFNGVDSFAYIVCDNGTPNLCDTGVVILDYSCTNLPPQANNDSYTTPEDQTLTVTAPGVMANDIDPDGGPITVQTPAVVNVAHGTLTLNANGSFTYTPATNYFGQDTFTYRICDAPDVPVKCDTAIAVITVTPVNDPPVVPDSIITTPEETPKTLCLPITDVEPGDFHAASVLCNPVNGTVSNVTVNNTGAHTVCFTYTPSTNFNGSDSLCLVVCDNGLPSKCDTTYIHITVTPVNDPPIANNDNYTTNEDVTLNVPVGTGVRANDNDNADGNPVTSLTVTTTPITNVQHGTLTLNANGSFTYVPTSNYCGSDSFSYSVCDAGTPLPSLCDTATAYITVNCVNDPPVVPDTTITTCEDCGPTTLCYPVVNPDNGQTVTVAGNFCGPNSGTATTSLILNTLCVTYTPSTNFNGLDSICIVVCDNGSPVLCDTSKVIITVTPVNDPPIANNDNYTTNEDVTLTVPVGTGVRANDNDNADGNPVTSLTVTTTPITNVQHGTLTLNANGSFTYVPTSNYCGSDSFSYSVCDAGTPLPSLCDTATAYITVNCVNDPPQVPDTTITTCEDCGPTTVCMSVTDVDVNQTSVIAAQFCGPNSGTISTSLVLNTLCVTYTSNTNFNGQDSICLVICDNGTPQACDTTHIHIIVTPVNDPPIALNDNYTTTEDVTLNVPVGTGVRANDNDNADNNPVSSLTVTTSPIVNVAHGTLTLNANGSFTYVPNSNYCGADSFVYRVCDAGTPLPSLCDTATAFITVNCQNDPPQIPDTTVTTCEDCPTNICIPYTDNDTIDIHTVTTLCNPQLGAISGITINQSLNILCFNYQSYLNVNGTDSLCLVLCDNGTPLACDTTHITIIVTPVNDPPVADTIYVTMYQDQTIGVNVASATTDPESNPLTYTYGAVSPNNGTFTVTGNGAIDVVPNPGFTGTFTIPYSVCDLSPYAVNTLCDSAAIIVTVLPSSDTLTNHAPVANNDYVTTPRNSPPIVINELANDNDPDGDALQVTITNAPDHGTYTLNANGTINYSPNAGFFGYDTIAYTICDPIGSTLPRPLCDNAIVVIYVSPDNDAVPNDAPVAVDDFAYICADANVQLNLLFNDADPNGDAITSVTILDNVNNGTLTPGSLGIYLYDPNNAFNGNDTLIYRICDNGTPSLCDTAMAVINVSGNPVITPSIASATNCSNDSVNITFTSNVPGTVITWSATNGTNGSGDIHTVLSNTGTSNITVTYNVTGVAPGGCGSTTLSIPVVVKPRPIASAAANGTQFCSGDNVVINLSSNIGGTTYAWSGSNGTSGSGNIISDNPTNATSSNITVTYTIIPSFGGCNGDTLTVNVVVKPRPVLSANPTTQTVCSGTPITVAISSTVTGTSVNWTGSNGVSGNSLTINDSPTNNTSGNITVTYTINGQFNGCAANTITSTVVVRPAVVANAGADKSVTACSASCVTIGGSPTGAGGSGTLTYDWSPNGGLSDTALANPQACNITTNTTYTVVVTDASGCSASDQVLITVTPSSLVAEAGAGGAFCAASGDSVFLGGFPTAVGGVPPYTYTWAPAGLNLTNPANPWAHPAGTTTYHLTVTDALGCTSVDSALVTVYPQVFANAGVDTIICSGFPAQLGATPTAIGGSGSGYTYAWSPTTGGINITAANPTAAPTISTAYVVTVTDGNGCHASDTIQVTVRPTPVAQAGIDKTLFQCPGDSVIIGDVPAAVGGTPGYTYSWSPSTGLSCTSCTNPVVKNLASTTTYTLVVTDASGCTSSDNVTVVVAPNNLSAHAGNDAQVCSGISVQLGGIPTAVGGTAPFVYDWNNGGSLSDSTAANPVASPAGTTTYGLTITDSHGCVATDDVKVTVNPRPVVSAGPDTSVCIGSTVTIGGSPTASGGTPGYTYSWNPTTGLSLPNVANPAAAPIVITTYQLVVTDSKGCAAVDEVTVTPRVSPVVDAGADKTIVACGGDSAFIGNLPVVVSGGTAPFVYDWTPGQYLSDSTIQNPVVKGAPIGVYSYQILVTDIYGCTGVDYVLVNVTPSTLQAEAGNNSHVCASAGTPVQLGGSPTAAGGTTPYTYSWTSTDQTFTSSLANPVVSPATTTTYYLVVTDSKGCVAYDTITISQNPAPSANAGADTIVCQGFCVSLGTLQTGSGGTSPLQYSWTPTVGLNANNTANPLACPLLTTTYVVQVTDSNGCQASDAVTVTVRPLPVADAGTDKQITSCAGDSVTICGSPVASGGTGPYTYFWSGANLSCSTCTCPVITGITSTSQYTLVVTDANGCTATDAVTVQVVPSTLSVDAGIGGSLCAGSAGGLTIGGAPTAVGGTTPYTYSWAGAGLSSTTVANPIATPTQTTTYYVTVTDAKGCISVDSTKITVNPKPTANAGLDTAICLNSIVQLGGSPTASNGTSPYTYTWAPTTGILAGGANASNPFVQPAVTTTYSVTVVDANGCRDNDAVVVTVRQNPVADAGADKSLTACSQDSVQIGGSPTATGGGGTYTYDWNPNGGLTDTAASNPYVKNIGSTTTYTVLVTDQFGCSATDQVKVNVANSTLVAEAGNDVSFCQGASVSVTLGGANTALGGTLPYSFAWTPTVSNPNIANPVATPTQTTTYTVVVTDATGCVASDTVRITINPRPVVNAGLADTVCAGACVTLGGAPTASGGTGSNYAYTWTPGLFLSANNIANPIACPTNTVTWNVTVTDSLGCSNNASVTIRVNQNPVANAGTDQTVVACPTACVQLGGTPTATNGTAPYLYAWAPAAGLNNTGLANPSACGLAQSVCYTLTVTDVNGCTATDQVCVAVTQSTLTADAGPDKSICAGQPNCVAIGGTNAVSGGTGPYVIDWSPVAGICDFNNVPNPTVNPTDTTTYVLLVQDVYGCIAIDSMVLYANPAVTASVTPDTAICAGGAALLGGNPTGSGGTPSYTYNWAPGVGLNNGGTVSANPVATPATTTTYCVTVTDAVGCSASTCQTVTVNGGITANAGPDKSMVSCPGSFVTIGGSPAATGGSNNFSYSWTPTTVNGIQVVFNATQPNPLIRNLDTTTLFTLTVTDNATGCTGTDQVVVVVNPSTLQVDAGPNKIFCSGGALATCTLIGGSPTAQFGTGPYTYQWSPVLGLINATTANPCASPLNTTTYYVTVTDQNGCSSVDSVTVTVSPQMAVDAGLDTLICFGTDVVLGGNPAVVGGTTPYVYAWTPSQFLNGTAIPHPTAQGVTSNVTYTLTVTDSLGCTNSDNVTIGLRPLPIADAGTPVAITACSGDSAVLGGSPTASGTVGPYTYSWTPPFGPPTLSSTTTANPVIKQLGSTTQLCVTVTDSFGCKATDCVPVTVLPNTVFAEAGVVGSLCSNVNGCVTLGGAPAATGGQPPYTYNWFGGVSDSLVSNPQACPLTTTTYTLIVADGNGCQASDTVRVTVNQPTEASISGLGTQYCINSGNVVMTGIPSGGTFSGPGVSGNVFQPSFIGAGTWCVKYTYTNPTTGCTDDTTICVTVNPLPVVTLSGLNSTYCTSDACVTLTGTPAGGTFSGPGVSGNQFCPALATIGNNTITYTYADQSGCSSTATFVTNVKGAPTFNITSSSDTTCAGGAITLTPNYSIDVVNIIWRQLGGPVIGASLNPISVTPTGVDYCVMATAVNINGCVTSDTICLHVNQNPVAVDDEAATCEEQAVTVDVCINDVDPEGNSAVITVLSVPHGTTSVNGCNVTYTPNLNYNGNDTIVYKTCNSNCANACDTALVYVSICPVNDTPTIVCVVDTIYQAQVDTACIGTNDVDGDVVTLSIPTGQNINGTAVLVNNCVVFTPNANFVGTQLIQVQACDSAGACTICTSSITVLAGNRPPHTVKVNATVCDSTYKGINVSSGATDPDGDPLLFSYGPITGPAGNNGSFYVTGNGTIVFWGDVPGYYFIPYYACDSSGIPQYSLCDTNQIVVYVVNCNGNNSPPVATDDPITTTPNTPTVINELANDFDPDGQPLTVTILTSPTLPGATIVLNTDNSVTYTSPSLGCDSILYSICDPLGLCDTAVIYPCVDSVLNTNHPPAATDDFATTEYLTPVTINVKGNDTDPDGDPITVVSTPCLPANGSVLITANGSIIYTPDSSANSLACDTFCYVVCDNGAPNLCDTATVVVCIDNSVVGNPECNLTGYHRAIKFWDVLTNDFDPEGDSIFVSAVINMPITQGTVTLNANGTVNYVPKADTCGFVDSFQYVVSDIHGATDTVTVCVTIICCPEPTAVNDLVSILPTDSSNFNLLANDTLGGNAAIVTLLSGPSNGTAYVVGGTIHYDPVDTYCGADTVVYQVETTCGFDTALFIATMNCNEAPNAVDDSVIICSGTQITIPVLANDSDPNGGQLTVIQIVNAPAAGATTFNSTSVTYTATQQSGLFVLTYSVCDDGTPNRCDTATVFIQVNNCPPIQTNPIYDTTFVNTPVIHCLEPNVEVISATGFTITSFCDPQNGTATITSDSCFTYTPDPGFFGIDTFCITVCDSLGNCSTAAVYITVLDTLIQAVDEPCDLDTTVMNVPVTIHILDNDIIPFGGDTTVTLMGTSTIGVATLNADNTVTFAPYQDSTGVVQLSYEVCVVTGPYSFCDTATICITVVDTAVHCDLPNIFTPNGDNVNDEFVIPCNEDNPKADLKIYDRWGAEVWNSRGHYGNNWKGTNEQGTELPDGTYYFIYSYNDGTGKREQKFVVIQR